LLLSFFDRSQLFVESRTLLPLGKAELLPKTAYPGLLRPDPDQKSFLFFNELLFLIFRAFQLLFQPQPY